MCTSDGGRDEAYATTLGARNTEHFASNAGTLQDHGVDDKLLVLCMIFASQIYPLSQHTEFIFLICNEFFLKCKWRIVVISVFIIDSCSYSSSSLVYYVFRLLWPW
jgi:hypothetical protein